jgi:hypothetical protein
MLLSKDEIQNSYYGGGQREELNPLENETNELYPSAVEDFSEAKATINHELQTTQPWEKRNLHLRRLRHQSAKVIEVN